jgi:hypothetical protein
MKKFLWAALLVLPLLAASPHRAQAGGSCWDISGCWRLKICAACNINCHKEAFCCSPSGGGGCCAGENCGGQAPGPWYVYWPYNGQAYMTAPQAYPGWAYDMHFQTPAPVYPYWPMSATPYNAGPSLYSNFQPAGYYPSYWYGR